MPMMSGMAVCGFLRVCDDCLKPFSRGAPITHFCAPKREKETAGGAPQEVIEGFEDDVSHPQGGAHRETDVALHVEPEVVLLTAQQGAGVDRVGAQLFATARIAADLTETKTKCMPKGSPDARWRRAGTTQHAEAAEAAATGRLPPRQKQNPQAG